MESDRKLVCDWFDCESSALAHFVFGMSAAKLMPAAVATHGNLCQKHIDLVNKKFTSILKYEIGGCPDGCSPESIGLAVQAPEIGLDMKIGK